MQLALLSRVGEVMDAHIRFFEDNGANLIHGTSFSDLYSKLTNTLLSGFVIDVPIVLKATGVEKTLFLAMEGIFPNVRTNWNPVAGFRALFYESNKSSEENLMEFLEKCRNFKARTLRNDRREEKTLNVLFWPVDESAQVAQRAYTLDLSCGGLFVSTCTPPPMTSILWLKLLELDDRPFKVLVRWRLEWGIAMRPPGFGASFLDLDEHQSKILAASLM